MTGKKVSLLNSVRQSRIAWLRRLHLSLFEKVIVVNSAMLIVEALAGQWVTRHNVESHHYLIDTSFIVAATLCTLLVNALLLRASFRPLYHLLTTIRAVSVGDTHARAAVTTSSSEIGELAVAFNSMLDRLETIRSEQTLLILQAQEDERRRIALELHDEAGQNLTALLIHTEILGQRLHALPQEPGDPSRQQLAHDIQQLTRLTQQTLENIRLLSQQLRPSVLDDLGLPAALRWLAEDSRERLHLDVTLHIEGKEQDYELPQASKTALFRIAQESLTNVARHAGTRCATLLLAHNTHHIQLEISDEGCGCDPLKMRKGSGIVGMRERAMLLKGTLELRTGPGLGTTIGVRLPVSGAHACEGQDGGELYVR